MFQSHSTQPLLPPEQMSFGGQPPQFPSQQLPLAVPAVSRDQLAGSSPPQGPMQQRDAFTQPMLSMTQSTPQPRHPSYYPDRSNAPQHIQHNIHPTTTSLVPDYSIPLVPTTSSMNQFIIQQHPQHPYTYDMHHLAYQFPPSIQQQQHMAHPSQQIFSHQQQRRRQHMQVSQSQFSHSTPAYAFTPPLTNVKTWAPGPFQQRSASISGVSSIEPSVLIAPSLPSQRTLGAASSSSSATVSPSPVASPNKTPGLSPLHLVAGNIVAHDIHVPSASVGAGREPHAAASFAGACDPSTGTLFQTQQQQQHQHHHHQQQGQIGGLSGCAPGIEQLTSYRRGSVVTSATPASVIGGIQGHEQDEGGDEAKGLSANGAFGSQQPIKGVATKQVGALSEAQLASLQQQQQQQHQQQLQQTFVAQQHLQASYFPGQGTQNIQNHRNDEQEHAALLPMTPPLSPDQAQIFQAQASMHTLGSVPLSRAHQQPQEATGLGLPTASPSSSPLPVAVPTFPTQASPATVSVFLSPTALASTLSTVMDISASPTATEATSKPTKSRKRASTSVSRGKGVKSPPTCTRTRSQKLAQFSPADINMSVLRAIDLSQPTETSSSCSSSPVASSSRSEITPMSPSSFSMQPPLVPTRSASISEFVSGSSLWSNTPSPVFSPLTDPCRQFKCNICDKRFLRQYNLNAHIKTHSVERNFPCNLCDRAFLRPYDLSRHQRIHSKTRPYQCKICHQDFIRNDAIWRHYRKIHSNHPGVPHSRRERRAYSLASGTAAVAAEAAAAAERNEEGEEKGELDSEEDSIRNAGHGDDDDDDDDYRAFSPSASSTVSSLGVTRTLSLGSSGRASVPTTPSPPPRLTSSTRKRTTRK